MHETADLWSLTKKRARTALESGALQPVATATETVCDGGIEFIVYLLERSTRVPMRAWTVSAFATIKGAPRLRRSWCCLTGGWHEGPMMASPEMALRVSRPLADASKYRFLARV